MTDKECRCTSKDLFITAYNKDNKKTIELLESYDNHEITNKELVFGA